MLLHTCVYIQDEYGKADISYATELRNHVTLVFKQYYQCMTDCVVS